MLLSHPLAAAAAAAALFLLGAPVNAIPTISAVGNKFFDSNGNQFFVKGVAYQLNTGDPLIDEEQCTNDAALMKQLGVNALRVYHVDSSASHDACMSVLENAGIYLFVDLDTFDSWLTALDTTWTDSQYTAFSKVMDAFQKYDNTLAFFIGNEVITSDGQSGAAPYIKLATRDMKAYRDSKGYRNIPIGYSAADIAQLRPMLQNYLVCGGDPADAVDFFGLNSYEWCGENTYAGSGYQNLNEMAQGYPVPIFFSETGCQVVKPRTFGDQAAILGPDMDGTWSGAIIYEWIEEANDYGLVSYTAAPTATRSGTPLPVAPDFANLQSVWATLNPTGTPLSLFKANENITTPACPSSTAGGWLLDGNPALPARTSVPGESATPTIHAVSTAETPQATSHLGTDTSSSASTVYFSSVASSLSLGGAPSSTTPASYVSTAPSSASLTVSSTAASSSTSPVQSSRTPSTAPSRATSTAPLPSTSPVQSSSPSTSPATRDSPSTFSARSLADTTGTSTDASDPTKSASSDAGKKEVWIGEWLSGGVMVGAALVLLEMNE